MFYVVNFDGSWLERHGIESLVRQSAGKGIIDLMYKYHDIYQNTSLLQTHKWQFIGTSFNIEDLNSTLKQDSGSDTQRSTSWYQGSKDHIRAVVVVKWSAYSPFTPMILVRIVLKLTVFSVKFVFEKNENKLKEAGVGPFWKMVTLRHPKMIEIYFSAVSNKGFRRENKGF